MAGFNLSQLATWDQARELAAQLTGRGIGRGVAPENADQEKSGIYTEPWLGGPGNFPEPFHLDESTGEKFYPLLLRFNNGAGGMNVGLIRDLFKRYPMSPGYVWGRIKAEVDSMAVPD